MLGFHIKFGNNKLIYTNVYLGANFILIQEKCIFGLALISLKKNE